MFELTPDAMTYISATLFFFFGMGLTISSFFGGEVYCGIDEDGEEIWLDPDY